MSFARLLAAGKSIINSGGSLRYRQNKSVYLPKFESPKNPFAKTASAPGPTENAVPVQGPAPAKFSAPAAASARPAETARSSKWPAGLNPLGMFMNNPARTSRPIRAEQTELTLDSVKVVGSDLSDADVEIVPLKSRPARSKKTDQPAADWSEVGTGVLGANLV